MPPSDARKTGANALSSVWPPAGERVKPRSVRVTIQHPTRAEAAAQQITSPLTANRCRDTCAFAPDEVDDGSRLREGLSCVTRELHLLKHLIAKRKNERESEIPVHSADGNADEPTLEVQHATTGHAWVAVRQTGD
jgi:hypothetical protein